MFYTIGEVSKKYNLPLSTLRYYDNEGLIPNLEKDAKGNRKFSENNLEALKVIECLKKSGLEIKEIKKFMEWTQEGNKSFTKRKNLFLERKKIVEQEIEQLNRVLNMLKFKCWYYEEAIKYNDEEKVKNIKLEEMPKEIKKAYENTL